mmetsp:Transcript_20653/g.66877  ORF Transcript_20653/g.66877 Transcript_20653/m.66877 type:complete len:225 (-) Transcript_20653:454-1128(-)
MPRPRSCSDSARRFSRRTCSTACSASMPITISAALDTRKAASLEMALEPVLAAFITRRTRAIGSALSWSCTSSGPAPPVAPPAAPVAPASASPRRRAATYSAICAACLDLSCAACSTNGARASSLKARHSSPALLLILPPCVAASQMAHDESARVGLQIRECGALSTAASTSAGTSPASSSGSPASSASPASALSFSPSSSASGESSISEVACEAPSSPKIDAA